MKIKVHDFYNMNAQSCEWNDYAFVATTIENCGLVFPIDKEQFGTQPTKGDVLDMEIPQISRNGQNLMKESLSEAGYTIARRINESEVVLKDSEGNFELWVLNDGHASYGVTIDGHDYEFCQGVTAKEIEEL